MCRIPNPGPNPLSVGLHSLAPYGDDRPLPEATPGATAALSAEAAEAAAAACHAGAADRIACLSLCNLASWIKDPDSLLTTCR